MARNAQIWSATTGALLDGPHANAPRQSSARRERGPGRRHVRLSVPSTRHARRAPRGLLAAAARRVPRDRGRARHAVARRAARTSHGLRHGEGRTSRDRSSCGRGCCAAGAARGRRNSPSHGAPRTKPGPTPASCSIAAAWRLGDGRLPRSFARALLTRGEDADARGAGSERCATHRTAGAEEAGARAGARAALAMRSVRRTHAGAAHLSRATATRAFEDAYWKTIAYARAGPLPHQEQRRLRPRRGDAEASSHHRTRDLTRSAITCSADYREAIAAAGMTGAARVRASCPSGGDTDFEYPWMGGWLDNQDGTRARAQHRRRDPGPGPPPGGDHGRPLRHRLHGGRLRRRRAAATARASRPPAPTTTTRRPPRCCSPRRSSCELRAGGEARARRLAGPPDRRGVPRRLPRRARARARRWSSARLALRRADGARARPVRDARRAASTCST